MNKNKNNIIKLSDKQVNECLMGAVVRRCIMIYSSD